MRSKGFCVTLLLLLSVLLPTLKGIDFRVMPLVPEVKATALTTLGIWSDQYMSRSIVDTSANKGTIITLKVNVTNSGPPQTGGLLNGFDVSVKINPSVLTNTAVNPAIFTGGLFASCPSSPCFTLKNEFNSATGTLRVAVVLLGLLAAGPSGMLFSFQLTVLTTGQSNIDIVQSATILTNPSSIGYVPLSGFFSNTGVHEVSVQSVNAAPEQVVKGDNATLTVVVANLGTVTETAVTVSINVTGVLPRILASVASKAIVPVNFSWNTTSMAPGVYLINATATIVSGDAFPGDNSLAVEQITVVIVDLAVTSIKPASNSVTRTQGSLSVSVNVTNYGSITSRANVTLYGNRTLANEVKIGNVAQDVGAGQTVTMYPTFDWNVTLAPLGNYTLSATVLAVQGERNTANNNLVDGIVRVVSAQFRDVGITALNPVPSTITAGLPVTLLTTLVNMGTSDETFQVQILANNSPIVSTTQFLSHGATILVDYHWDTTGLLPGVYSLRGETILPGDQNPSNDQFSSGTVEIIQAPTSKTVVGVWSKAYRNANITDTSLLPGSTLTVQVNVTNAPAFNGFDFFLYYDPAFLNATSIDVSTDTLFNNPFVVKQQLSPAGTIRIAVVNLGSTSSAASGTIANINFRVVGVGVSPLTLAAGTTNPSSFALSWTRLTLGNTPLDVTTADGYFKNVLGKLGPLAQFKLSSSTRQGQPVVFDATGSYDSDNVGAANKGITRYDWDYGDQSGNTTLTPFSSHEFISISGAQFYGNFSVRLTVTDSDDGFQGMVTLRILVGQTPLHDLSVFGVTPDATRVAAGKPIDIKVELKNLGTLSEVFNLTVQYAAPTVTLGTTTAQNISPGQSLTYHFTLNTTGLDGFYTVTAEVSIPVDDVPSNNIGQAVIAVVAPQVQHDLSASLFAPSAVALGSSATILAVVTNNGQSDETGVRFDLLVNGQLVQSQLFSFLGAGGSSTIGYTLTPSSTGILNITARVPPVPGETLTSNNVATKTVTVLKLTGTPDPRGDTFGLNPPQLDIAAVDATFDNTNLVFNFTFYTPISAPSSGQSNSVVGYIDIDSDQNPATGAQAFQDLFGRPPASGLGDEFYIDLFSEGSHPGRVDVFNAISRSIVGSAVIVFTSQTLTITVPLSLLGGNGLVNYGTVIGNALGPTDEAPNQCCVASHRAPTHDIAVVSLAASPTDVVRGQSVMISIIVENQGTFSETFDTMVFFNGNLVQRIGNVTLPPGNRLTLTVSLDTTAMATGNYTVSAAVTELPGETDIADNRLVDGQVSISEPPIVLTAKVNIDPDMFVIDGKTSQIIAGLTVPKKHTAADVDFLSIRLQVLGGSFSPVYENIQSHKAVELRFDAGEVGAYLKTLGLRGTLLIDFHIAGKLRDGTLFEAFDTIQVVFPTLTFNLNIATTVQTATTFLEQKPN